MALWIMMLFVATAIPVSLPAESSETTFYYQISSSASGTKVEVYFAKEKDTLTDPGLEDITWSTDDLASGSSPEYYLNVTAGKTPTVSISFSPFSGGSTSFGYEVSISHTSDAEKHYSGTVSATEQWSTIFSDVETGERQQYAIEYTFQPETLAALGEGLYSSTVTVKVTVP